MEYDRLIQGKNPLERIVGVEINEDQSVLFLQNKDGSISSQIEKNRFWILSNRPLNKTGSVKLAGELHYKYGQQYSSKKDWNFAMQDARKRASDTYTIWDPVEQFLVKDGYTMYKGMTHTEPSILSFDIETTGLFHNSDSKVLLISNTFRKNGVITRKLFAYDDYKNNGDMLLDWCKWVVDMDPSIICGHNIYTFDLPYLQFIADREDVKLNLGRNNSPLHIGKKASKFRIDGSRDQEYHKVRIYGREVIDTMFLAIRHDVATKKYESYGLKSIIKAEGLEKNERVFYNSSTIRFNYKDSIEWSKIKEYCIHDSDDGLAVYDLTAPATFYLTNSIPKSFQSMVESASGSQINSMMVRSYLQEGHSIPKASLPYPFEGAISFGNPGIYSNIHKVDISSLYPSIILECSVYDDVKDPKGNFLKIIETFTNERLKNKKLAKTSSYHDGLQSAQKIVINSGYGFMAAPGLNFNSPSAAKFITETGRNILNQSLEWAAKKKFIIPNADTDSISYAKEDQSFITEDERKLLLEDLNSLFPKNIRFEDDGYYPKVCIMKAKNYVLYDGKKIKIKGSALKASGKPPSMKEMIKRVIDSIINDKSNYQEIYLEYVKEAANIKDMSRWASRKTISDKTLNSERTNETRIKDAIQGTEIVEGDRVYVYNKTPTELCLVQNYDGVYDVDKMLGMCYDTIYVFENIMDCELLFKNFKLKRNKEALREIL
jgi:DNA polymerase elongation subunit (family B)